ncbi:hypothetical protein [Roseateles sp. P5_E8]
MLSRNWFTRHQGGLVFALSLLALVLILLNSFKHGVVSLAWFAAHKDAIAALNSLVTMSVLVVASVFSYFRFFRGRTLALRAEVSFDVSVHSAEAGKNLHGIAMRVKNVGSVTIWNPIATISLQAYGPEGVRSDLQDVELLGAHAQLTVIEPGEVATFFAVRLVESGAWATAYFGSLEADHGDRWNCSQMVSNVVGKSVSPG